MMNIINQFPGEGGDSINSHTNISSERVYIKGKFLYCRNEKIYIKGVTYGTFKPDNDIQYPETAIIEKDFEMMAVNGINCVRTYTVPPLDLLDTALKYNLKVMVGLPWEQHITFLDSNKKDIIRRVRKAVTACKKHPAILCYSIGNEIPAPIVRWYGKKQIEPVGGIIFKLRNQKLLCSCLSE